MEYLAMIIIGLIMISMFLPWSKWFNYDFNGSCSYDDAYELATEGIKNGDDPQELYNACHYSSISHDKWDKGWMQACVDNGAKNPEL